MTTSQIDTHPDSCSADDRRQIARLVKAASTSFYGAMRILPKARREAIFAVYAFCRAVDDIADDEGASTDHRISALDGWRADIAALFEGRANGLVTRALSAPVEEFNLRRDDFIAVIDGMEMDARGPIVAPCAEDLAVYCDRVASAVGRLCVKIFGEPGKAGTALAQHLGLALQLTNILRDVDEDAAIGRLYLPREVLAKHGVDHGRPDRVTGQPGYAAAWREVAGQASSAFERADAAMRQCTSGDMRPARIMMEVYRRNLERMTALDDAAIADRGVSKRLVSRPEKILIALRYGLLQR